MRNHFLRALQKGAAPTTDPNFRQVALLLHGDGTNGSQNNTFIDSSTNNFSITRNGNATQGTFSPFSLPDGQWSNFFDGSGDYLTVGDTSSTLAFGTGDFTIEMWVYSTAFTSFKAIYDQRPQNTQGAYPTIYTASGVLYYYVSGANRITGPTLLTNTWYHIAVCRSGTSTRMFVNGTQVGSTYSDSTNYLTASGRPFIASFSDTIPPTSGDQFAGYISNVRVVKGTAVYTSSFTPPTTGLTAITNTSLLTCQSNRFRDNSSNNFTLTRNGDVRVTAFSPFAPTSAYSPSVNGGSGYFDGTGDYLTIPDSPQLQLGSDNFTIECWFNTGSLAAQQNLFSLSGFGSSTAAAVRVLIQTDGNLNLILNTTSDPATSINISATAGVVRVNSWNHLAVVRNGSSFRLYLNGSSIISTSASITLYNGIYHSIGARLSTTWGLFSNGYVSDFRVVKGTAVYTANFTPPTAPLTAITNTSLLLNFTNAGIVDSSGKNVIETVGNAQVSTSVTRFGTGSIVFDGTDDTLILPPSPETIFGTAPFTIEGWVYITTHAQNNPIISKGVSSLSTNWFLRVGSNKKLEFFHNGTTLTTAASDVNLNTWYHFAVVGNRTSITIYLNGVQDASVTYTYNYSDNSRTAVGIGRTTTGSVLIGYLDDLRITNGVARYTANFTPPSAPYPDL